jgi:hypothetical protein
MYLPNLFYPAKSIDFVGTLGSQPNLRFGWGRVYWTTRPDKSGNYENLEKREIDG